MNASIVEERGSYLLIVQGDRFAVVERRNNHFCNCHDGKRDLADDISTIAQVVDETDWVDEISARKVFNEAASQYTSLTERMR